MSYFTIRCYTIPYYTTMSAEYRGFCMFGSSSNGTQESTSNPQEGSRNAKADYSSERSWALSTFIIFYFIVSYVYCIIFHTITTVFMLCHTIRYYIILYYIILYYTILYYTILYYTILYYTILYYAIIYYTILYYTIVFYSILYCSTLYFTVLYSTKYQIFSKQTINLEPD